MGRPCDQRAPTAAIHKGYKGSDTIVLYCAYCGVKLNNGNAVIRAWDGRQADIGAIREQRAEHDRIYHPVRWWNRQ